MSGLRRLTLLVVVVAGGATAFLAADRGRRPTERSDPPREVGERADSLQESVVPTEVPADIRDVERSRRARRPADPERKTYGLAYDRVLEGRNHEGVSPRAKPAEPMPPTPCRSVEPAPRHAASVFGPYRVHDLAV